MSPEENRLGDERGRLAALDRYRLRRPSDGGGAQFQSITDLVADLFGVSICTISIINEDVQYFAAATGVEPGLTPVPIVHEGNTTESLEESLEVVRIVGSMLGRAFVDTVEGRDGPIAAEPRPLRQSDLIVVTPYNAQLAEVRAQLDAAGHRGVRVGTVDKFQGQEAVIAIVSLAASSAADVPRGMSFLLMKNRLNVAISRAKWAAYLVHSPLLTEFLPTTPDGVGELSAFIRLVEPA